MLFFKLNRYRFFPKTHLRGTIIVIAALFIFLHSQLTAASATESHRYLQHSGDNSYYFDWILDRSDGYLLRAVSDAEEHVTVMDDAWATQRWSLTNTAEDTAIEAFREGNRIVLQGRFRGERLDKEMTIDDAPWFQSLSSSLRPFLYTPQQSTEFWTLRPDKLTLHKVRACKKGREMLKLGHNQVEAHKVEVRLTGIASLFGSGCYWFRSSDQLLLHYQGPRGLPGIPSTTITLEPPF